jgi:hypothetical protein
LKEEYEAMQTQVKKAAVRELTNLRTADRAKKAAEFRRCGR